MKSYPRHKPPTVLRLLWLVGEVLFLYIHYTIFIIQIHPIFVAILSHQFLTKKEGIPALKQTARSIAPFMARRRSQLYYIQNNHKLLQDL